MTAPKRDRSREPTERGREITRSNDLDARALQLFQELIEAQAPIREAKLNSLGPELAARVRELLRLGEGTEVVEFEQRMERVHSAIAESLSTESCPAGIEGYEVLEEIGRGGMGIVYRATQKHPARTVALKVLRPELSNEDMLRRFEFEASVLASLDHPGIARIIEAGTADVTGVSVPYFAMEFIEGDPLDLAASSHLLTVEDRVVLLRDISLAVHHAHLNGVLHRDLKPKNIMLSLDGSARVMDFGIARTMSVDDQVESMVTSQGEILGTLAFMSPEQLGGCSSRLDVRTDVYSLGVIGYWLLTGDLPHDLQGTNWVEAARKIQGQVVTLPALGNVLGKSVPLRDELRTIVNKACEKDRAQRYGSAAALAGDLARFLNHEPIQARPPTAGYRLRKFARRHRGIVTAVVAVFVTLIIALAATSRSAERAMTAEVEARSRAEVQTAITEFLVEMFESVDPRAAGATGIDTRVVDVLAQASGIAEERFADHPDVELGLRKLFATSYFGLTDFSSAEREVNRALELCTDLEERGAEYLDCRELQASIFTEMGRPKLAEPIFRELIDVYQSSTDGDSAKLASQINNLAQSLHALGRTPEALELLEGTRSRSEAQLGPDHEEVLSTLHNIAVLTALSGDYENGAEGLIEVLERRREILGPAHMHTMLSQTTLGSLLNAMGRREQAHDLLVEGVALRHQMLGEDNMHTWDGEIALALALSQRGNCEEALRRGAAAVENIVRLQGVDGKNALDIRDFYARSLLACDKGIEAVEHWRIVWERRREAWTDHPLAADAAARLGQTLVELGRAVEAVEPLEWAVSAKLGQTPADEDMATTYRIHLVRAYLQEDRGEEARRVLAECIDFLSRQDLAEDPRLAEVRGMMEKL